MPTQYSATFHECSCWTAMRSSTARASAVAQLSSLAVSLIGRVAAALAARRASRRRERCSSSRSAPSVGEARDADGRGARGRERASAGARRSWRSRRARRPGARSRELVASHPADRVHRPRPTSFITSTAQRSRSSPAAWPRVSLTSLKWSRSSMISPSGRPVRAAALELGVEALLEAAAVEAAGQRVGARHARQRLPAAGPGCGRASRTAPRCSPGRARRIRRTRGPAATPAPPRHIGDVVQRRDRRPPTRAGTRAPRRRRARRTAGRAGWSAPPSAPCDDRGQRDLRDAPQQEERLPPAAAHDALVGDQHEQQRHDRADAEQRGDQLAVRAVPGGGHVEPSRGADHQRQPHAGADAFGASAQLEKSTPSTCVVPPYEHIGGFGSRLRGSLKEGLRRPNDGTIAPRPHQGGFGSGGFWRYW